MTHVHVHAEYGRTLGRGRFASWRECGCGDVVDYEEHRSPFLAPADAAQQELARGIGTAFLVLGALLLIVALAIAL